MGDRTVKVTLTAAVSGYLSGMDQAARKTQQFTQGSKQQLDQQAQSFQKLGQAALAMGTVAAAGVAFAVKTFADFDAKMSQVQALSHATGSDMLALREAAMTAGQGIGFSASQVADAETELVKAGVSVKDILGGALPGALQLAAAGQIDVGQATEIATIALTQFKLQGKDIPHVADLLSAGADKALGGVADLGEALKSGGLVAAQFGVSLDETVGVLSSFANAGLLGETAGTDLRQMLLKLANPSADAAKTMKALGINIYDAQGKFVGMSDLAGQLQTKMGGLSEAQRNSALATIFGSRAIAGANVLYKEGAGGISDWTKKVNDAGFAQQQATLKMNNLEGDVKKLGAAFENDLIKSGSGANEMLRGLTQSVTVLVRGIGSLPQPVLSIGLGFTALVAGVGLLGGGFLTLVPKIAATRAALGSLGVSMRTVGLAGGGIGLALMAVADVVGTFTTEAAKAQDASEGLADTLNKETGALTENSRAYVANQLQKDGTLAAAKKLGLAESDVVAAYLQQPIALSKVNRVLKDSEDVNGSYVKSLVKSGASANDLINGHKKLSDALGLGATATKDAKQRFDELAAAEDGSKSSTKDNTAALASLSGQAADADGTIKSLADTISSFGKGALDVSAAERDFQAAIDDAAQSVKDNGKTLDINTDKGRQNSASLDQIAKSALGVASSQATAGASQAQLTKTMATGRAAFIAAAVAAGMTRAAAGKLADQYGLIPANVKTSVVVIGTPEAKANAAAVKKALDEVPSNKGVTVSVNAFGAFATLDALNSYLNQLGNKEIALGGSKKAGGAAGFYGFQADGSVLDFYAAGGVRENHTAQIAPAGSWRVWAEPETGGEAYIPLAPSKRERSLSIWEATGRRLGVQGFADGGITYVQAPPQMVQGPRQQVKAPVFNVVVSSRGGVDLLQYVDVRVERARQGDLGEARRGARADW